MKRPWIEDRVIWIEDGVLWIGGAPQLILAGEYPYYRDNPRLWLPKLRAMKLTGLNTVSFYVPWRHHEVARADGHVAMVFSGEGNRDLVRFVREIGEAGLFALPKPGPFVHAELPFGGLPDRVSPSIDPSRIAALSSAGEPLRSQGLALPSAHDPAFLNDASDWLRSVGAVLQPHLYPDGPIVAVQIGNEGFYGESALPVDALDYSEPAVAAFERFCKTKPPRYWSEPKDFEDLEPYLKWGEWISQTLVEGMQSLAGALGLDVPAFCNYSPPKGRSYDAWRVRLANSRRSTVGYAYTSWAGNVVRDDAMLVNYVLAAKAGRGPNLEENWSLDWVEPECAFASVPVYHALLGIACGATGLDVYTACATSEWGDHLRIDLDPPYGGAAPIGVEGDPGANLPALAVLTHFLGEVGPDLVQARPEPGVTFCTYAPYAAIGAWNRQPPSIEATLIPFVRDCLTRHIPFAVGTLSEALPDGPLVVAGGLFLAADVQRRLAEHVQRGGKLRVLGELPEVDEHLQPCRILADTLGGIAGELPEPERSDDHLEFRLIGKDGQDVFVFLFSRADEARTVAARVGASTLTVDLAPRGCAAVRVLDGRLAACYVKGLQERTGEGTPVRVLLSSDQLKSDHACDMSAIRRGSGFDIKTQGPLDHQSHSMRSRGWQTR